MHWEEMAVVGRIARAHGIRGQVIVNPGDRFSRGTVSAGRRAVRQASAGKSRRLTLDRRCGFTRSGRSSASPASTRWTPRKHWLASSCGCRSIGWRRCPPGPFYRHDLVGCRVETGRGEPVGIVTDVEGTMTAAGWSSRRATRRNADSAGARDLHDRSTRRRADRDRAAGRVAGSEQVRRSSRKCQVLRSSSSRCGSSAMTFDIVTIFPAMVEQPLAAGHRGPRDRARDAGRAGPRPARFHDRSAPGRGRCAVWRRAGDGAEAGADVPGARRDRGGARRRSTVVLTSPQGTARSRRTTRSG